MMTPNGEGDERGLDLERLIADITLDSEGEDEQLWAFLQAFQDGVDVPCDAFIIGEPVSVAASEVTLAPHSRGRIVLAAYRKWIGIDPVRDQVVPSSRQRRRHKATPIDLDLSRPVQLIVLSVKERAARCRLPGTDRLISLRASGLWEIVPGEIAVVKPAKQWSYGAHPYLSGEIESARVDAAALGLAPLGLSDEGEWDPSNEYWNEEGEPLPEWVKPIIERGPRREYEMEQVVPGLDLDDLDSDPILESNDLKNAGDAAAAYRILMELCEADLRCLDAHAHLGNMAFDTRPEQAIRHFEVGVRIGELSLPSDFDGLLSWDLVDNRPFMRCLHGYGLCLWRLDRFEEAERTFKRMLWLNPSDNQGTRFLLYDVQAGKAWEDCQEQRR